ncbi:YceI family protein [Variovorax sp. DT-64]|uniref:YceI family protein n=1 Tax=Variovorax sp. DT-64 TaxID=3396160 RepID=UPI003F195C07
MLRRPLLVLALVAAWVAACAPLPREVPPGVGPSVRAAPAEFPRAFYEQALSRGQPVYRIEPARSLAVITVRRGGSLARLGHDHVVASRHVQGLIAPGEGRADLYLPLAELSVDEPALRAEAGLDTQPSDADIAATRANMLDKVLEVQRFPFALIRVSGPAAMTADARLGIAITLHGTTRRFDLPVRVAMANGELKVAGTLEFDQSEFGIVPFSVLGGAIQVQDRLSLRFSLQARRAGAQGGAGPWSTQ